MVDDDDGCFTSAIVIVIVCIKLFGWSVIRKRKIDLAKSVETPIFVFLLNILHGLKTKMKR